MPTSTQLFAYQIEESYFRDDVGGLRDRFNEYQRSHCYDPQRLTLTSAHDCIPVVRDVDCGHCYHCRETKINSWVTRMYAHCEDFPYVYFITLTYRPFYKLGPVSALVLKKLNGALWHYDSQNEGHHLGWNPTTLCKKHYQDFLKRLRKNTQNTTLTYALSGEYGHEYGRPHFHLILFSKVPVEYNDIRRAWSVGMWKGDDGSWSYLRNQRYNGKAYYFEIGRIDMHDLVSNGSFNECQIPVDGQNLNARNCFAYVCKYVCKGGEFNDTRLRLAHNALYERNLIRRRMKDDFYDENMSMSKEQRRNMTHQQHLRFYIKNKQTDFVTYYETRFKEDERLYVRDLLLAYSDITTQEECYVYPKAYRDFCAQYGQFVEVSRGCPIGSIYAKSHISEFVSGHFGAPALQTKGFVVPSYFRRKAEEHVYGLRKVQRTISGKSLNFTPLPLLLRHFEDVYQGKSRFLYCFNPYYVASPSSVISLGSNVFKDVSSGEYIIFPKTRLGINAEYYKYDRKSKDYFLTRITGLSEFLRVYIPRIKESIQRYEIAAALGKDNARLLERSAILLDEYGMSLKNLRGRFAEAQDEWLKHRQHTYHMTHTSVE